MDPAIVVEQSSCAEKAAAVSSSLIRATSESLDQAIESALGTICSFVGATRASLLCLSEDRRTVAVRLEWPRAPSDAQEGVRRYPSLDCLGLYQADLLAGKSVVGVTPDAFRRTAHECTGGPGQCVFFPVVVDKDLGAVLGVYDDSAHGEAWTETAVKLLGMVKDAMANAVMRVHSENVLRESERRCQMVFELVTDYAFRLAVAADGSVSMDSLTDNYFAVTGRTPEEAATVESWDRFIHPEDLGKVHALLDQMTRQPRLERIECRSKVHGGVQRWIEVTAKSIWNHNDGRVTSIVGAVEDITDRKQAEQALRLREYYLTAIIENQPGLVWLKDADSRFLAVNRAFARSCGREVPEELIGKTDLDVWPKELAEKYRNDDAAVMENGTPVRVEEPISDEGERRWFETFKTPVRNAQNEIIGTTGYAHDITERKQEEETLRTVQKLESLGILAGGIAHDFNNLLGGVFGYVDLALEKASRREITEPLARALATIDRARGLTRQLLTFAKGGAPIKKIQSLVPFIEETARFALSGSRISCDFHISPDLWLCEFDRDQIAQVIDNIVINAQQAMPDGGTIDIRAENAPGAAKTGGSAATPAPHVRVSVTDRGIGMPREIIQRIFDPFFTTKTKGHGLGLATCYSIVHRHGGWIDVESEPGKGSTFHVYLPADPHASPSAATSAAAPQGGSGLVVIMDDEEVIRDVVGEILESLGYSVIATQSGREVIDVLRREKQAGRRVEAVILDLTVPGGMGGQETASEIHKIDPQLPVFVASGYAEDPVVAAPRDHGFAGSLRKPFTRMDLAEMLHRCREEQGPAA